MSGKFEIREMSGNFLFQEMSGNFFWLVDSIQNQREKVIKHRNKIKIHLRHAR